MRKDLHQLFDEFLFESEFVRKIKPQTIRGYKNAFWLFKKLTPSASLQTLSTSMMTTFFKALQERKRIEGKGIIKLGVKKSTVATYWHKLNAFFHWLESKRHVRNNPLVSLSCPTPIYEDRKFLRKEEIERIVTAIHCHHDHNIFILKRNLVVFYLLLFCGLRKAELLSLQVRDVDFERKALTVRAETSKTDRSRQLPLHSTLIMHLKDYLNDRKTSATPHLIVSVRGNSGLSEHGLKHLVERIRQFSGVSFHLHQFRHTFAVNFLNASKDIAKLKQLLGHKSIAMTLTYLRCLPTDHLRGDIESMSIDNLI
ncbi:MAG: site-specific integrase [Chitinophagaceae bacterium]|nr:site-specific integrase [Chitinophagaceae bacterium]